MEELKKIKTSSELRWGRGGKYIGSAHLQSPIRSLFFVADLIRWVLYIQSMAYADIKTGDSWRVYYGDFLSVSLMVSGCSTVSF